MVEEKKEVIYSTVPKFVQIVYDDSGKPVGVQPVEGQEASFHLSPEDKNQIWDWLSTLNKNIITLRNELSKNQTPSTVQEHKEEHPVKSTELVDYLRFTNENINNLRAELQKDVIPSDQVLSELVTKADMAELIQTLKMALIKQKMKTSKDLLIDKTILPRIFRENLRMLPGEKVIIVSGKSNLRLAKMLYKEAAELSGKVYMIVTEKTTRLGQEPDESVSNSFAGANIIIGLNSSLIYTDALQKALLNGARFLSLPSLTSESFKNGAYAPYMHVSSLVQKIYSFVKGANKIRVSSENGTLVTFSLEGRRWFAEDGLLGKGRSSNFPAGELTIAPSESTVEGKVVFDSCLLTKPPAVFHIQRGLVKKTKGRVIKLSKYFKEIGEKARVVGEFGIGCNPKAKFLGNYEDRKVLGSVHFGLGSNHVFGGVNNIPFHVDGIIHKPNVFVDDKMIIREGRLLI